MITAGPTVVGPTATSIAALLAGPAGEDAFAIAVDNGYTGTRSQWLASLVGQTGPTGSIGPAGPPNILGIGSIQTGSPGSAAQATIAGTSPTQTLNLTIPTGAVGPQGPAPWQPPAAWASGAVYSAAAPASCVTYTSGGNLGTYVCITGHTAGATFDTTKWVQVAQTGVSAPSYPNVFSFNGLTIKPGATPASQVAIAAAALVLKGSATGLPLQNVSATVSTGTVGANGLDTGTIAASKWYAVYGIATSAGNFAGLLSLSATSPTLPSGYVYAARLGWARTKADGTLLPIVQNGRSARFQVVSGQSASPYLSITSGAVGDPNPSPPTFVAVPITNFAPSTAAEVKVQTWASTNTANNVVVAPNPNYGAYNTIATANPPVPSVTIGSGFSVAEFFVQSLFIEGANVYAASQANSGAVCLGWEDNL